MDDDRRHDRSGREFRLEGGGLYLVGALFLAALAVAFYAGRWVERRATAPATFAASSGALPVDAATTDPDLDVGQETTYFDTLSGEQKQAEPGREMPREQPADAVAGEPSLVLPAVSNKSAPNPAGRADPAIGPFYVQVFAGRDQASAESLVGTLHNHGYRVRLDTERSGDGALYKVRVGGYAAKADAQLLAERLRGDGHSGAWVTRVD